MNPEQHKEEEKTPSRPAHSGRPVILYIIVMFIAALMLMMLSMLMHQRTTAEGIGDLQHSFSAMADMQAHQEKIIALQDELDAAKDVIKDLEDQLSEIGEEKDALIAALEDGADALLYLYRLQNAWLKEDLELCRTTIQTMETLDLTSALSTRKEHTLPSPAETYAAIKADVEAQLAQCNP